MSVSDHKRINRKIPVCRDVVKTIRARKRDHDIRENREDTRKKGVRGNELLYHISGAVTNSVLRFPSAVTDKGSCAVRRSFFDPEREHGPNGAGEDLLPRERAAGLRNRLNFRR